MFGLILRLGVFCALVFGVVYGITRALKDKAHKQAVAAIQEDIERLEVGLEAGIYSDQEGRDMAARIQERCRQAGIDMEEHINPKEKT